uniref:Chromo domain-containing protein n=1 Tax=Peronospora matthiolae TaxID=2874970 RepID=A0AAV1T814_9STRA
MGNAYTIELPRKMRTHPPFYVGRLRPYYQHEPVLICEEHLRGREPRPPSSSPVSTSQSVRLAKRPAQAVKLCLDELQPAHHEENESNVRSQVEKRKCGTIVRKIVRYGIAIILYKNMEFITPSTVMSQVILQLFRYTVQLLNIKMIRPSSRMKRILNHHDVNGVRTSYVVRWRGYPPVRDSWEPRAQPIVDVLGLVEQYDETHPLLLKKGRRKMTSPNASTGIARFQSLRPSQKRCAPSSREHKGG